MNIFYNNKILFVINVKHTDMDLLLKQLKVLLQERNIPSGRLTLVPKNPYEIVIIPKREEEFIWDKEKNALRISQPFLF